MQCWKTDSKHWRGLVAAGMADAHKPSLWFCRTACNAKKDTGSHDCAVLLFPALHGRLCMCHWCSIHHGPAAILCLHACGLFHFRTVPQFAPGDTYTHPALIQDTPQQQGHKGACFKALLLTHCFALACTPQPVSPGLWRTGGGLVACDSSLSSETHPFDPQSFVTCWSHSWFVKSSVCQLAHVLLLRQSASHQPLSLFCVGGSKGGAHATCSTAWAIDRPQCCYVVA